MNGPETDRLPFVIGVTGHRDLHIEDLHGLRREVYGIIERLKRDYLSGRSGSATNETPIIILSDLAEGADQLVVQVALGMGARLIAPMPMPLDLYRQEFQRSLNPGALADFEDLRARAFSTPVVPFTPGNSRASVQKNPDKRREQYRAARIFIARHCHVLISLWDGHDEEEFHRQNPVGSTAETVNFRRRGLALSISPSVRASLDSPESGAFVHLTTPRMKSASPAKHIKLQPWGRDLIEQCRGKRFRRARRTLMEFVRRMLKIKSHNPEPDENRACAAWENFAALIALTVRFNEEAVRLETGPRRSLKHRNLVNLFKDRKRKVFRSARTEAMRSSPRWCLVYGVAETLAQKWQRQFRHDWLWLFVWALAALVCFEFFAHVSPLIEARLSHHAEAAGETMMSIADTVFLSGYLIAFVLVFQRFFIARVRKHQERFLDYRALAEALRVAIFWRLAGISRGETWFGTPTESGPVAAPGGIVSTADVYPLKQPSELAWVKTSLRTLELLESAEPAHAGDSALTKNACCWICALWLDGQRDYFDRRRRSYNDVAERREGWASFFLLGSLSLAAALAVFKVRFAVFDPPSWIHHEWRHDLMIFVIGILPGVAAAFLGFSEKIAYKAQARQYDRMYSLFERALTLLEETSGSKELGRIQRLFAELGLEALRETAEWVAIYRQRPIQPP
jgi:hypothetical protein